MDIALGHFCVVSENNIKKLSNSSMESSLFKWLPRNKKEQTPSTTNFKAKDSAKETCNSSSARLSLKQSIKPVSLLWNRVSTELNYFYSFFQAISLKMAVKKNSIEQFFQKRIAPYQTRKVFDFNFQQDVAEICKLFYKR